MALNSTMYKADLHVADMDRHYYQQHQLMLSKHPSETDERIMVRLLAFALYADAALTFGKGIGDNDEPALWKKDMTGDIKLWIEVGLPDERILRKASGRATHVVLIMYGRRIIADRWWDENQKALTKLKNVTILYIPAEATLAMAAMATRNMQFTCTIEDAQIMLGNETATISIEPVIYQRAT